MQAPPRISPQAAHDKVQRGALLVCGYDDQEKWEDKQLAGAIPLSQLEQREPALDDQKELIFYCD